MTDSSSLSWLALGISSIAFALVARTAIAWRDRRLLPFLVALTAVPASATLEILTHYGVVSIAKQQHLLSYRSLFASIVSLGAVIVIRRIFEQERELRASATQAAELIRTNAALERELMTHRQAEEAVNEAQTRLRAILDNTPASIWIKDLAGRYLYINQPRAFSDDAALFMGMVGKTDAEVFPSDLAAELRSTDLQAIDSQQTVEIEHTIASARGTRTYLTVKFPLRDADGEIYAVAGVASDMTRRAEAANAVRRVFQLSPALMCTLDASGRFAMVNPALRRILGYDESEIIGRRYDEFVHADDLRDTREQGLRLQRGETDTVEHENRYRARDGKYRVLSWQTTYVAAEQTFYAAATDVTDKANEREAIRRIYRLAPALMCTFDWEARLTAVNPAMLRVLGYAESEMVGHHYSEFVHPDDLAVTQVRESILRPGKSMLSAFENRYRCKDGSYRTLSWDASSAPDDRTFYAVARDVTDARRDERRMAKRRDEMAHHLRLQTIGEMASEMSHELNQPLGAIVNFARGLATRLRAGSIADDEMMSVIEKIAVQALRGGDLIRKILVFARRGDLDPREGSLNDVVRDTIDLLGAGPDVGAEIALALDETLPSISIDRSQMQQVLLNLVRNALDAVDGRADRRLVIRTALNDDEVRLSVSDNGPGIPQAESERIFDAFYTTRPGGVGLGLPISRSIVQAHDGRLWVESTPGAGTTFHVDLPVAAGEDPHAHA